MEVGKPFKIFSKAQTNYLDWCKSNCSLLNFVVSFVMLVVKNLPAGAEDLRDVGSIPGLGRSPGEGNGNPLQYSCLDNPMDRGTWRTIVHSVTKSWT